MKMIKKTISAICATAILMSVTVGCASSAKVVTVKKVSYANAPTLTWWACGGQPSNLAQGLAKISQYTYKKIGVKVNIKLANWGDWDQKMTTIVNSGEYFDLMFTNNTKYNKQVTTGAFANLTSIVKTASPSLYKLIPQNLWNGVKINGKIYSVPTYKDSSISQYWAFDDTYVKKYKLTVSKITTMSALDKAFRTIKKGEGANCYPLQLMQSDAFSGLLNNYDDLTLGFQPIGVNINDKTRKVVSVLQQASVMQNLKYLHAWYKDGIINPDAPTLTESPKHRIFQSAQGFPGAEASWQVSDGVKKYDTVKIYGPEYTTSSIQGSLNGISANSKYKTQSLKLLQLVNTDSTLRNMLAYGVEGTNFSYTNAKKTVVKKIDDKWTLCAYQQGTFFNMATTVDAPADQWKQVKKLNEKAKSSTCLGFALNIDSLGNEVANTKAVWDKYRFELMTGASDPTVKVPQIVSELKAAGMTKIITQAQTQINKYFKK